MNGTAGGNAEWRMPSGELSGRERQSGRGGGQNALEVASLGLPSPRSKNRASSGFAGEWFQAASQIILCGALAGLKPIHSAL